jgi:hypothetical protein
MGIALPKIAADYGDGMNGKVLIQGRPLEASYPGEIFWVDENAGRLGRGTFKAPDSTIDAAYNRCVAGRGDKVFVKPGHSETSTALGGIVTMDVDDVALVGFGRGDIQSEMKFGTVATNHIKVTGDNNAIIGFRMEPTFDDIDLLIDIDGSGFLFAYNFVHCAANLGTERFLNLGAGYGELALIGNIVDFSLDDDGEHFLFAEGTNAKFLSEDNFIVGPFSVGCYDLDASSYTGMKLHRRDVMINLDTDPGMCVLIAAGDAHIFVDCRYGGTLANTVPVSDVSASFMFETYMTDVAGTYGVVCGTATAWA